MGANLYEQSKEIAILRSIGFTRVRIWLIYFYEAILVVFSACLFGIVVGVLVGLTMVLQQDIFLHQPFDFYFPWRQTIEILLISVICALLSTLGPAYKLTRMPISQIFRVV